MAKPAIILALVLAGHLAGPWIIGHQSVEQAVMSDAWTALIYALAGLVVVILIVLWLTKPVREEM